MEYLIYLLCGAGIGLCNGFFGSGGGVLAVLALERLFHLEPKKAHATAIFIILPLSLVSMLIYTKHGFADWKLIWQASLGGLFGGILGAKLLSRMPQKYIHKIFAVLLVAASVRMVTA